MAPRKRQTPPQGAALAKAGQAKGHRVFNITVAFGIVWKD
jgi:hypothetical protein